MFTRANLHSINSDAAKPMWYTNPVPMVTAV